MTVSRPIAAMAGLATLALATRPARADLRADELLLLVNANVPESAELAAYYAEARHVPADRILRLNVGRDEEISPADYDAKIAGPVRAYLRSPAGEKVRCLVTFYGLPIRVSNRTATPAEQQETVELNRLLIGLDRRTTLIVQAMEAAAKAGGVDLRPARVDGVVDGRPRVQEIERAMNAAIAADPAKQPALEATLKSLQQRSLDESVAALQRARPDDLSAPVDFSKLQALLDRPRDGPSRAAARHTLAAQGGVFALHQIVTQQITWLNGDESVAAVDSELALVKLDDFPRSRWQPNPFSFHNTQPLSPMVVMTARIDAPTAQIARRLIDDSVRAEADGLDGRAAFDSRGLPATKAGKPDPYAWYDRTIRDVAATLKSQTSLDVVTDDREQVMLPHTVDQVALYCGWYSLRNYVPACTFVTGAVAYHVASFEMVSLHAEHETGWVANLLRDNVAATMGPVAEPYLGSFCRPDEFFPLLLTGKLTLAEVYWKTAPMTSWMQALIGDPLYRPYAKTPKLKPNDLPGSLRAALPIN